MTTTEALKLLGVVTYKPGASVVGVVEGGALLITVQREVPDVRCPSVNLPILLSVRLPKTTLHKLTRDHLLMVIFDRIMTLERHEAMEWFRVDGKPVRDPHFEGDAA